MDRNNIIDLESEDKELMYGNTKVIGNEKVTYTDANDKTYDNYLGMEFDMLR